MSEQTSTGPHLHEIRKYPNRRYYNTRTKSHLTIEGIQSLIQDGHEIRVTDSKTDDDITAAVLLQIILGQDPLKLQVFPVPLLHALIRASGSMVQEFMKQHVWRALDTMAQTRKRYEDQVQELFATFTRTPSTEPWSAWLSPILAASDTREGASAAAASNDRGEEAAPGTDQDALHKKLEQLQAQLAALREEVSGNPAGDD